MSDQQKLYETVQYVAVVNAYSLSKEDHKIYLKEFNKRNRGHRALLSVLYTTRTFIEREIYVQCKLVDFWRLRRRHHKIKWCRGSGADNWPTTQEFIDHIEGANGCPGIFEEMYQDE